MTDDCPECGESRAPACPVCGTPRTPDDVPAPALLTTEAVRKKLEEMKRLRRERIDA